MLGVELEGARLVGYCVLLFCAPIPVPYWSLKPEYDMLKLSPEIAIHNQGSQPRR